MSATVATAPAPAKGKKKLILIVAVAVLVLAASGGAALLLLKKKPADAEDADDHAPAQTSAASKRDAHAVPIFVPLDPFTVNLADRDAERYAQIGVTLEIDDSKTGEQIKAYMPAIRNRILMAIADRNSGELLGREGKAQLADRIRRETSAALGFETDPDDEEDTATEDAAQAKPAAAAGAKKKKKKKKAAPPPLPVRAVHFSNFIIQ